MKTTTLEIGGVKVSVGKEITNTPGLTIRLGTVAVRYVIQREHGLSVKTDKFSVIADLDSVSTRLTIPYKRNDWEKEFRHQLGSNTFFIEEMSPEGVTDVFPVRLNPTTKLYNMGWKKDHLCLKTALEKYRSTFREKTA